MTTEHRSIGKVADPNYMGDCEACGEPWPCREVLRARLAEVEQALRKYGKHMTVDGMLCDAEGRGWAGVGIGPCTCGLAAVLDKGEPTDE